MSLKDYMLNQDEIRDFLFTTPSTGQGLGFSRDNLRRLIERFEEQTNAICAEAKVEECRELLRRDLGFVVLRCLTTSDRLKLDLRRSLRYTSMVRRQWISKNQEYLGWYYTNPR